LAIVLFACIDFSNISVLLIIGCGVGFNALAKTVVKLCRSVFCKMYVKSTDGVGFIVVVVVAVVLAAAAVDN